MTTKKNFAFVFPCDFMKNRKVDDVFLEQYNELKSLGFDVFLVDIDNLDMHKKIDSSVPVIYRGWMLSVNDYRKLNDVFGGNLFIQPNMYAYSHYFVGWYSEMFSLTFDSVEVSDENEYEKIFLSLPWKKTFVKDYVKSLKTGHGAVVENVKELRTCISEMKKFKGFIEGGLVFREYKEMLSETEERFFVFNKKVYGSLDEEKRKLVEDVACKHHSPFFSVDVAYQKDGKLVVVEIGDGQVSDYVGWDVKEFCNIFASENVAIPVMKKGI